MPRGKKKSSSDPKEKILVLKKEVEKRAANLAAAQDKLKAEESRQLELCVKELISLTGKIGSDIYELTGLVRLFVEQNISVSGEIEKLSGEQLEFGSPEKDESPADTGTIPAEFPAGTGNNAKESGGDVPENKGDKAVSA